jgi:hypothetical protein
MHQQLKGYIAEDKIYLGARERERLNITGIETFRLGWRSCLRHCATNR